MDKFQIKKQIKRLLSEEYNMGGFTDGSAKSQQSTLGSNGDSTMNTPTIKEKDGEDYFPMYFRKVNQLVKTTGYQSALDYIFDLVKTGKINPPRFSTLIHLLVKFKI